MQLQCRLTPPVSCATITLFEMQQTHRPATRHRLKIRLPTICQLTAANCVTAVLGGCDCSPYEDAATGDRRRTRAHFGARVPIKRRPPTAAEGVT
jgi:hypothetical protein